MILSSNAMKGPPITMLKSKPLILSEMNNPKVILLNPCFFSIAKVEYYNKQITIGYDLMVSKENMIKMRETHEDHK